MSELSDAFAELKDAQDEVCGKKQRVRIGRKYYEAIIETLNASEVYVSGGTGETGGFKVHVAMADLAHEPKKFTPIQVDGSKEMSILNVNSVNGVTYVITAGDPIGEEAT